MKNFTRRDFLQLTATAGGSLILHASRAAEKPLPHPEAGISFFLIGDTHYLARQEKTDALDEISRDYTSRLVNSLNRLPGTNWPESLGGGTIPEPRGLIHAGDLIDSGNLTDAQHLAMQQTEIAAFESDFGVNGGDGRLRWPVHEVFGNHDAPQGAGRALDMMRDRNKRRKTVANVSANGIHHSWDWDGVHFINLGIVVGAAAPVERPRVYSPLESLDFLISDLARHVGESGKPVVITHHVDVARYSTPMDPARAVKIEWDYVDVSAYYQALKGYHIAGIFYGHTHVRRTYSWDGRPPAKDAALSPTLPGGVPIFNTAKASHFNTATQAYFHFQITDDEVIAREFATKDGWLNGTWTPQMWRFPLRA